MQTKRISDIVVSKNLPRYNDLWLDTSEGENNAVLKYKGNPIAGGGNNEPSDPGYNVTKSYTTLADESVEVISHGVGMFNEGLFTNTIDLVAGKTYKVSLNGVEYECQAVDDSGDIFIGNMSGDFVDYPFIICGDNHNGHAYIDTAEAGTYTVKIEEITEEVTVTPEFKFAVDSVTGYSIDKQETEIFNQTVNVEIGEDWGQAVISPSPIELEEGRQYIVIFDGIEYNVTGQRSRSGYIFLGAREDGEDPKFNIYPFYIAYDFNYEQLDICTANSNVGNHTVVIKEKEVSTNVSAEFTDTIREIAGSYVYTTEVYDETVDYNGVFVPDNFKNYDFALIPYQGCMYLICLIDHHGVLDVNPVISIPDDTYVDMGSYVYNGINGYIVYIAAQQQ